MEEILCLVNRTLENSGYKNFLGAGVVLTGGTALIEGCQELGTQIFNLPTRIGYPPQCGRAQGRGEQPQVLHGRGAAALRRGKGKFPGRKVYSPRTAKAAFSKACWRV